jgi:alpha-2-macroglobulin
VKHATASALLLAALPCAAARAEEPPATGATPLQVQLISPTGRSPNVTQVTVVFSQPMVPLGAMERSPDSVPVELSCTQKGQWRWLDPSTLAYLYDEAMPPSTSCSVQVTAAARSLSGAALAAPVTAEFETQRIGLVRAVPATGSADLDLQPEITVVLNQSVDVDSIGSHARVVYKRGTGPPTEVPVTAKALTQPKEPMIPPVDVSRSYVLRPVRPLPRETDFEVVLTPGIRPAAGTLSSDERIALPFKTYPFLRIDQISCSNDCRPDCSPTSGITLVFTTPVEEKSALAMIKIEPPLAPPPAEEGPQEEEGAEAPSTAENYTTYLHIPGPFEPDTDYTITVLPDLEDQFGQRLGTQQKHSFHFGMYWPSLDLNGPFAVFESEGEHRYPLGVRNVQDASLRFRFFQKDEIVPFLKQNNLLQGGDQKDLLAGVEAVQSQKLDLPVRKNRSYFWPLDLDKLFGADLVSGLAYMEAGSKAVQAYTCTPEEPYRTPVALQVTDLGLTAKIGYFKTLIWATSLSKGQPVEAAAIEIRDENNKVLARGQTDKDGLWIGPGRNEMGVGEEGGWREFPLLWVFAQKDKDVAFIHSNWSEGIEAWNFSINQDELRTSGNLRVYGFTDRPIYRPGDAVRWKSIARSLADERLSAPSQKRLVVEIRDSQGEVIQTDTVDLNEFGSAVGELKLARRAKLGQYDLQAGFDAEHLTSVGSFQVEEYRAPTLKVEVQSDKKEAYAGESVLFQLQARYHFGAPVSQRPIRYTASRSASAFQPKGLEGYETQLGFKLNEELREPNVQILTSGQAQLSSEGAATASVQLPAEELSGPVDLEMEAEVQDQDSRLVAGRSSVLVHPAGLYVGLRPKTWGAAVGSNEAVDVLVTDPSGQVQSGVPVSLKLYRRTYNVVRRKGVGSFYHYEDTIQDTDLGSSQVTSGSAPVAATFKADQSGLFYVVAEANDSKGRKTRSSTSFYAWGGALAGWARYDHDRIDLVPERPEYSVGDVAKILVKSPYESARALVTVERDSVMRSFLTEVQGSSALIEVPIQTGDAPNVFVSVLLVQGRVSERFSEEGVDLGKPSFKIGYTQILVRDPTRKLAVEVKPAQTTYGPRDHVKVDLQVKDSAGGPVAAELCVVAVDEAVLQLVSTLRYDPYEFFYAPQPLGVRSVDTRIRLVGRRHFGSKGENPGGGGGPASARKNFQTVAVWQAQVPTDESGKATVEFDLPDNLTSFRIVAVAADRTDRFGSGWSTITVTKPLVSQPSLPRFLVEGDRAEVGVLVHNGTGAAGSASVTLAGEGFEPAQPPAQQSSLESGQSSEVRFPIQASAVQELVLRFASVLGANRDDLEARVPVHDATPLETYAAYGSIDEEAKASIDLLVPPEVRTDRGGLAVNVSSTLASTLEGSIEWLRDYPYACLEQQASRALMYGIRLSLSDRLKGSKITAEQAGAGLDDFLANLPSFQSWEGGFAYWLSAGGESQQDPYLTAYVLLVLHNLDAMGHPAEALITDRALEYLDGVVRHDNWPRYYDDSAKLEARAFALSSLGQWGRLEEGLLQPLRAARKKLSLFGLGCLMDAELQLGGKTPAYQAAKTELMSRAVITSGETSFHEVEDDGLRAVLSSPVRSNARVLLVLAAAEPGSNTGAKLMRWLMKSQKAGRWDNTHENAFGLLAAHEYLKVWEAKKPTFQASASIAGLSGSDTGPRQLGNWSFQGVAAEPQLIDVPMQQLQPGQKLVLDLQKQGPGRLYYGLRLQLARQKPSAEPVNSGFTVLRQYVPADGGLPSAGPFARGKLVKVRLTVSVPALRHFVAVEDLLPAGFEAVNLRLATESRSEAAQAQQGSENDEERWDRWYDYVEKRDDRVVLYSTVLPAGTYTFEYLARATTLGTFAAGAPHAEEMYAPEVYGRGRPTEVQVSAP